MRLEIQNKDKNMLQFDTLNALLQKQVSFMEEDITEMTKYIKSLEEEKETLLYENSCLLLELREI